MTLLRILAAMTVVAAVTLACGDAPYSRVGVSNNQPEPIQVVVLAEGTAYTIPPDTATWWLPTVRMRGDDQVDLYDASCRLLTSVALTEPVNLLLEVSSAGDVAASTVEVPDDTTSAQAGTAATRCN